MKNCNRFLLFLCTIGLLSCTGQKNQTSSEELNKKAEATEEEKSFTDARGITYVEFNAESRSDTLAKQAKQNINNILSKIKQSGQSRLVRRTNQTYKLTLNDYPELNYTISELSDEGLFFLSNKLLDKGEDFCLMDISGKIIVEHIAVHDSYNPNFSQFEGGYAVLHNYANRGIIDTEGNIKLLNNCTLASKFVDGVLTAIFWKKKEYSTSDYTFCYLNTKGERIFPALTQDVDKWVSLVEPRPFVNGLSCYYDYAQKLWGFFNTKGEIIIPARFENAHDFSEGLCVVKERDKAWGYINVNGEYVIGPKFHAEPEDFHNNYAVVYGQKDDYNNVKEFYIHKDGSIAMETSRGKELSSFFYGYASIASSMGSSEISIIDTSLHTIKKIKRTKNFSTVTYKPRWFYYQLGIMSNGNYAFTPDGTIVYSTSRGNIPHYAGKYGFYSAQKPRSTGWECGFVNAEGEFVIEFLKSEF